MSSLRNYEIRQKLGSGSYGVIYKAYNKIDKSVCVLKQISLTRMSEKARKNAANEAHIMGKLKHPFIVCYHESFVEDSNLNILMEFCEGGDLCYLLKQQNKKFFKEEKIWKFFIQICMGLQHIHKNKILHRDIKTLNIFLNKNETVKIGDLGVAKMLNANDFAHTMVGTPFYLSPELCEQKPYNQKSDIWALGCLLYELCTFRHPFEAANQASLILKIIRGKYEPIPEFYSKELTQMINLCLQRDYKRRPTAAMILAKPNIKKMMEEFELNKIVQQFYNKPVVQTPQQLPQQVTKPEAKVIENKPVINKVEVKPPPPTQKPKKVLDDAPVIVKLPPKIEEVKIQVKNQIKQQKKQKKVQSPQENIFNKRRESQPAIQKEDRPKVLFGSENKADFISALESKLKSPPKRVELEKPEVVKKTPISFEIPWKGDPIKKNISESNNEDQGKVIVHNKNILLSQPSAPPQKNSQVIHKIKMEKKVEPKVYEMIKQNEKPAAIIKSAGFSQGQRPQTGFDRKKQQDLRSDKKSIELPSKSNQQLIQPPKQGEKQVANSMKNILKSSEQRPSYVIQKQPQGDNQLPHYPPKFRKPSVNQQQRSKIPKHLPHQKSTSTSASRFTEVTKQQQDLVANLPDKVKKRQLQESYVEQASNQKQTQNANKIKFKEIDDQVVLKMYQEMMKSSQTKLPNKKQEVDEQQNGENIEQMIQQNPSLYKDDDLNEIDEEEGNNSELYYQVNKYQTEEMGQPSKTTGNQQLSHEWSFDQQPELPLLEQTETPLFEQANPYLVEEMQQTEIKTQEEILEDKKQHLQIKLKQNIKREDEINRLMQMKIQECKAVVPKNFDEILIFFRSKINMDREYTEQDEKQVETFLARRNLTDQRKFQNIYKIMHFEMQLENTRRIIQSICKKLNQLQKQKNGP